MIIEDLKTGSGQITHIEGDQDMDKIIEAGQDIILIIEVDMGIIQEVIGMGGLIIIIEGEVTEVKIMTGIEIGHMKDRTEIGETAEV